MAEPDIKVTLGVDPSSYSVIQDGLDFEITVSIHADPLYRPSLFPQKYEGVENIFGLFTQGYTLLNGNRPFGTWHGEQVFALPHRDPTPFVREAVNEWVSKYGSRYNIKNVTIGSPYG